MITRFEIFERVDIEKTKVLGRYVDIIISSIKKCITESITELESISTDDKDYKNRSQYFFSINDELYVFFKHGIDGGSYKHSKKGKGGIIYYNNHIFLAHLDKIDNYIINKDKNKALAELNKINWSDFIFVVTHESTHRFDKLKFPKSFKKFTNDDDYLNNYSNLSSEYNAHFLARAKNVQDAISAKEYILPSNFEDFKRVFIQDLDDSGGYFYKTTKFQRHLDKRIYDLYVKLKSNA